MDKYTLEDIKALWERYEDTRFLAVLRDGKWTYKHLKGKGIPHINGTRARIVKPRQFISFPSFIEKYHK